MCQAASNAVTRMRGSWAISSDMAMRSASGASARPRFSGLPGVTIHQSWPMPQPPQRDFGHQRMAGMRRVERAAEQPDRHARLGMRHSEIGSE